MYCVSSLSPAVVARWPGGPAGSAIGDGKTACGLKPKSFVKRDSMDGGK